MTDNARYFKETAAKIMKLIRQYPYASLTIGTRAALALYEILQTLTILKARNPVLTAALITLPHRIKNESIMGSEQVIEEIIKSMDSPRSTHGEVPVFTSRSSKTVQMLRELDSLNDVIHAMPYDIDILSPEWFKVTQVSLFKTEAPVLLSLTFNKEKKADFNIFMEILEDLQQKGLIRFKDGSVNLTTAGSLLKYKNIFKYIEKSYPSFFKTDRNPLSSSEDVRKYQRGDAYKSLHIRRTLKKAIKRGKNADQISKAEICVKETSPKKRCMVVLALDHSWSMARSKKLQYTKDAAAGLVFAVKKNNDKISLIAFSDNAVTLSQPTRQYDLLIKQITRLRPENETNVTDVFLKSRRIFSTPAGCSLKHLIIITDGIPTSKIEGITRKELENKILTEVAKMRKMKITISVICIRDELEENDFYLANKIASIGRGSFSLVRTEDLLNQMLVDYSDIKSREV